MHHKPIYTFRVDFEKCSILDDDFVSFMDRCFNQGVDFDVAVADVNGMGFVPVNIAINLFINDCRKDVSERCYANPFRDEYFGEFLKEFIEDYIRYYWHRNEMMNSNEYYPFDVFNGHWNCKVFIPKEYISDDVYMEYRGLGPDFLMGAKGINSNVLFHHILPAYYFNLIYDDLVGNEKYSRLQNFQIGLA